MRKSMSITGALALTVSLLFPVLGSAVGAGAESGFAYSVEVVGGGEGGCRLVKVDLVTAAVTELSAAPSPDACMFDLAVAPDATPWGIYQVGSSPNVVSSAQPQVAMSSSVHLAKFDGGTGAVTGTVAVSLNGNSVASLATGGLAIGADGTVYAHIVSHECATAGSVCLVTVNPTSGVAATVGPVSLGETRFVGLADCGGLVSISQDIDSIKQFQSVSATTGATTPQGTTDNLVGYDCAASQRFALKAPPGIVKVPALAQPQFTQVELVTFDPVTGGTVLVAAVNPEISLTTLALPPVKKPTTTTTATPTTTAPAVQAVTVQPKFTG